MSVLHCNELCYEEKGRIRDADASYNLMGDTNGGVMTKEAITSLATVLKYR